MILTFSLVGNHNLVAKSVLDFSQKWGLGGVWGVCGGVSRGVSGWCLEGCLWWGSVWGLSGSCLKRIRPQDYGFPPNYRSESHKQYTKWKLMHRPTTFKTFGPIKGSFWTPKLQKIKWNMISGTPCICVLKALFHFVLYSHRLQVYHTSLWIESKCLLRIPFHAAL